MPFVSIEVAGPVLAPEQVHRLQLGVTGLLAKVLRKRAELTAVRVLRAPDGGWSVGGRPARVAAHLEVTVTAGTNTGDEKARFVADAMQLLRDVLGPELDPVAYVIMHEVPGDAWGWDGQTQAARGRGAARSG